jgi:hypothetical protein
MGVTSARRRTDELDLYMDWSGYTTEYTTSAEHPSNRAHTQEVALNDGVGQREELACLLVDFLPILRTAFVDGFPVLYHHRHISVPAISTLPSPYVDIFSPAKQASKQRESLSGSLCLVQRRRQLDAFDRRRILRRQLRNWDAVNRKKSPQTSIFLPETNVLLLRRLEW